MKHNWKAGDQARVKYTRNNSDTFWKAGIVVNIHSIEKGITLFTRESYDCILKISDNRFAFALFEQLEPVVPDSSNWEDIEAEFGWNPTKEKVDA